MSLKNIWKKENGISPSPLLLSAFWPSSPAASFLLPGPRPSRPPSLPLLLSHPLTGRARLSSPSSLQPPPPSSLPLLQEPPSRSPAPTFAPTLRSPRLGFKWRAPARPSAPSPIFPLSSPPFFACCTQLPTPELRRDPPREIRRSEPSLPRFALW